MAAEIISRADAQARCLKRYFTGFECSHGHVAERQTSNGVCIGCRYDIEKRWKARNPEKRREKTRRQATRHRAENPDRIQKNKRRWELRNPDKLRAKERRWNAANPDRKREHDKKWRESNPDKVRAKNARRDYDKHNHARRARKLNAGGAFTTEQKIDLLHRQKFRCAACGASIKKKRHLDHIVALSRGGSNDITNLQWLCVTCNCSKHNKDPMVWAREQGRLL